MKPLISPFVMGGQQSKYIKRKKRIRLAIIITLFLFATLTLAYFFVYKKYFAPQEETPTENTSIVKKAAELEQAEVDKQEITIPTEEIKPEDKERIEAEELEEQKRLEKEKASVNSYIYPSDTKIITVKELETTSIREIELIKSEIYARHGYIFKDDATQEYFESRTWYKKNESYSDDLLSDIEIQNIKILSDFLIGLTSADD